MTTWARTLACIAALDVVTACSNPSDDAAEGSSSSSDDGGTLEATTLTATLSAGEDESSSETGILTGADTTSTADAESSSSTGAPPVMIDPEGDGDWYEPPPYEHGPDSMPQDGVPQGTVMQTSFAASAVYPGTTRSVWVYVPAQYDPATATASMVFQDGGNYVDTNGLFRTPIVLDNLIQQGAIPPMVAIFVNPGAIGDQSNRSVEYDALGDEYSQFLLDELLPTIEAEFGLNLSQAAEDRGISGHSSGGICAFTVGWHRPDAFGRIMTHNGSFTDIMGGGAYPQIVLDGPVLPLRVFLLSGTNDLDNQFGNWLAANEAMAAALAQQQYHYRFVHGEGGHSPDHAGAVLPDTLRWLWREPLVEG